MIAPFLRLPVLDRIAALYAAVYVACLALGPLGIDVPFVLDAAFYPLGLVVGWANWRNSQVAGLDARTRLAWRLLAAASFALWLTGSLWTALVALFGRSYFAFLVDRAAVVQYVLAMSAYVCFPAHQIPRKDRRRFAMDVAFIVVAGSVIAFYMGVKIWWHPAAGLLVVESFIDWALFIVVSVGCVQKRDPVIRRAVVLLLTANLASLIGNYLSAISFTYHNGDPADVFWFAAWMLRWGAARHAWRHYAARGGAPSPQASKPFDYPGNPFAYVLVAGSFALLFTQILGGDTELLPVLAVAAFALGALFILRQFEELRENRRLLHSAVALQSRFTSLVSNSSDVVLVIDGAGVVSYVSPSLTRVFGPDVGVAPGSRVADVVAPDSAEALAALLAPGGAGVPEVPRFETRVQVAPGRWREIEAVWTDLRSVASVNGIVVNCRDVTDRNEIERHLRHAQKLDAMGHLAGGLAHDLNNVLAVIRGYAELLQSELEDGSAAASDLEQIVKAVDRAAAVTQKVLAFSRKQPGQRTRLDLNEVVREVRPMLGHLTRDQVEVRLDLEPSLWPVLADQGQLEQVLVNLVTNARDAMPEGGVLEISTANRPVAASAGDPCSVPSGEYVAVAVRDDGIGMPPAVLARVFEPFFSTKPPERGIGLGLAIVHGIVTDLDGRVQVESVERRGSTFTILIPRAAET